MIFIAHWLHIGVILGPFWVYFGSVLGYFWCLRVENDHGLPKSEKSRPRRGQGEPKGDPSDTKGRAKGARREPPPFLVGSRMAAEGQEVTAGAAAALGAPQGSRD